MKEVTIMKLNKTFITLLAVFFILSAIRIFSQTTLSEYSIKFEEPSVATLVGQDGLIMRTIDGGVTWDAQTSGITNVLYSIEYAKYINESGEPVKMQIAVGENGVILKSLDDGLTWVVMTSGTLENLNDVNIFTPNLIFACGNNGVLLKSVDYGETWTAIELNTTENLNDIASTGPSTLEAVNSVVVVGTGGKLFASANMEEWAVITSPVTENLLSVTFSGNSVIAAGDNGTIIKSINNGIDWVISNSGITTKIFDIKFVTPTLVIGSSENGVMVRSEDAGDNWTTVTTPSENDQFAVNFGNDLFGISTGFEGSRLYTTDGGLTWATSIAPPTAKTRINEPVKLNQNYPNPFNPSTVISYDVNSSANVTIKVYDMTGREVRTLVNSFQNAGTYSVNFNASNLASGIYFYVLRMNTGSAEFTKTMKMILTK